MTFKLNLVALVVAGIGGLAFLRARPVRGKLVELLPPDSAQLDLKAWLHLFQGLYGMSRPWWKRTLIGQPWLAFELWAHGEAITARAWFPDELEPLVLAQLHAAIPGCVVRDAAAAAVADDLPAARSRLKLWRDPLWPLASDRADALRAVTVSMTRCPAAQVQLAISPHVGWQRRALIRLDQMSGLPTPRNWIMGMVSWPIGALCSAILPEPARKPVSRPKSHLAPTPPADKAARPGYLAEIRIKAWGADRGQAKYAAQAIAAGFRSLDGDNGLRPARVWFGRHFDRQVAARSAPSHSPLNLIPEELVQLFHLPCGDQLARAPLAIAPPPGVSNAGKVLAVGDVTGDPIAISPASSRHHIHVVGPTGSGKSTLLLNLALDDIRAGRGVAVVDTKGDLVRDLLERLPADASDRLVLLDPSARERPVGLNVLECADPELREVVCDQIVAIFKKTYDRYWGPRTDDVLRCALLTLLRHTGSTLCEVPLLLQNPAARARYREGINDPIGLESFWNEYEQMAEGQRVQMVGPLLNKLRSFLLRRTVRNVLGQSTSTIDLAQVLDSRGILLVSLAKGLLGEETSRLLGSFLVARIWQAAMARADRPESRRPDFSLYLDEFQNYLHLPQNLDGVLVEARGDHLGLVLAHQHLGQLATSTREALAANARTRVVFQSGQDDARYLAREFSPWLEEHHLRNLQPFQVAVRMYSEGRTERPFTGVTRPLPSGLGGDHADRLREEALSRYGRPRDEVERLLLERLKKRGLVPDEGDLLQ